MSQKNFTKWILFFNHSICSKISHLKIWYTDTLNGMIICFSRFIDAFEICENLWEVLCVALLSTDWFPFVIGWWNTETLNFLFTLFSISNINWVKKSNPVSKLSKFSWIHAVHKQYNYCHVKKTLKLLNTI